MLVNKTMIALAMGLALKHREDKQMTNPNTPSDAIAILQEMFTLAANERRMKEAYALSAAIEEIAVAQAFRESRDSYNWSLYTGTDMHNWIAERAAQLHANATTAPDHIPDASKMVTEAYTAADIPQASADGFRAGVASVAAPDGDWVAVGETFGASAYLNAEGLSLPDGTKLYAAAPKPEGV